MATDFLQQLKIRYRKYLIFCILVIMLYEAFIGIPVNDLFHRTASYPRRTPVAHLFLGPVSDDVMISYFHQNRSGFDAMVALVTSQEPAGQAAGKAVHDAADRLGYFPMVFNGRSQTGTGGNYKLSLILDSSDKPYYWYRSWSHDWYPKGYIYAPGLIFKKFNGIERPVNFVDSYIQLAPSLDIPPSAFTRPSADDCAMRRIEGDWYLSLCISDSSQLQ